MGGIDKVDLTVRKTRDVPESIARVMSIEARRKPSPKRPTSLECDTDVKVAPIAYEESKIAFTYIIGRWAVIRTSYSMIL